MYSAVVLFDFSIFCLRPKIFFAFDSRSKKKEFGEEDGEDEDGEDDEALLYSAVVLWLFRAFGEAILGT